MTVELLSSPMKYLRVVGLRRCIIDMFKLLVRMDREEPVTVESVLDNNIIGDGFHKAGVNMCFLKLLLDMIPTVTISEAVVKRQDVDRLSGLLEEAIQAEMLSRALKDMCAVDITYGVGRNTGQHDVAKRIDIANRIGSLVVDQDPVFWTDHLMPFVRQKFAGCEETFTIPVPSVTAGRLLCRLAKYLGTEVTRDRFSHFCPIAATKAMLMRPPRLTKLYRERQFSELDAEVPKMWTRWRNTPTNLPLRHSLFVHSAVSTLLSKATEKFAFVLEAGVDATADYDHDPIMQAEMLGLVAEVAVVRQRDEGPLKKYSRLLCNSIDPHPDDGSALAVKLLGVGLINQDVDPILESLKIFLRMEPQGVVQQHSATFQFALSVLHGVMMYEQRDEEVIQKFFDFMPTYLNSAKLEGPKAYLGAHLHVTSTLVASIPMFLCWRHRRGVEFAAQTLERVLDYVGAKHRLAPTAALHLMLIGVRSLHTPNKAVELALPSATTKKKGSKAFDMTMNATYGGTMGATMSGTYMAGTMGGTLNATAGPGARVDPAAEGGEAMSLAAVQADSAGDQFVASPGVMKLRSNIQRLLQKLREVDSSKHVCILSHPSSQELIKQCTKCFAKAGETAAAMQLDRLIGGLQGKDVMSETLVTGKNLDRFASVRAAESAAPVVANTSMSFGRRVESFRGVAAAADDPEHPHSPTHKASDPPALKGSFANASFLSTGSRESSPKHEPKSPPSAAATPKAQPTPAPLHQPPAAAKEVTPAKEAPATAPADDEGSAVDEDDL